VMHSVNELGVLLHIVLKEYPMCSMHAEQKRWTPGRGLGMGYFNEKL
jgi:hypothetical protein